MKKSLIILPVMAALLLAGCTSGGGKRRRRSSGGSSETTGQTTNPTTNPTTHSDTGGQQSDTDTGEEELPAQDCLDFGPEEFGDYKRVMHAPENGKEYYMGFYHINQEKMRFVNGKCHNANNKDYPFYLGTSDDIANAVRIVCEYDADNVHYAIKVVGGGEGTYYDGKYLEIYDGTKDSGAQIVTIRDVTDPVKRFHYEEKYANYNVHTTVIDIENPREGHQFGIFGCTIPGKEVYETVAAQDEVNFGNCYVAHFWEHK